MARPARPAVLAAAALALGALAAAAPPAQAQSDNPFADPILIAGVDIRPAIAHIDFIARNHGADHPSLEVIREHLDGLTAPRFGVSFPGGPAMSYVDAVRAASKNNNIVTMPGVEHFTMPPVTLTGVSVEGALVPLEYARPTDPRYAQMDDVELEIDDEDGVFVIAPEEGWPPRVETEQAVWSVASLMGRGGLSADDVLTAVQSAADTLGAGSSSIKFHAETRLLIVEGPEETLMVVDRVLDGLEESAEAAMERREHIDELELEADQLRVELDHARAELDEALRMRERVEQQVRAGDLAEDEGWPAEIRSRVRDHEREVAQISSRIRRVERRIERLRDDAG